MTVHVYVRCQVDSYVHFLIVPRLQIAIALLCLAYPVTYHMYNTPYPTYLMTAASAESMLLAVG